MTLVWELLQGFGSGGLMLRACLKFKIKQDIQMGLYVGTLYHYDYVKNFNLIDAAA